MNELLKKRYLKLSVQMVAFSFFMAFFCVFMPEMVNASSNDVAFQDQQLIRGKVTDAQTGEALPGATAVVKGTTRGAVTSMEGDYSIEAIEGEVLVFSFVGYVSKEIVISAGYFDSPLNIELESSMLGLNEVIVVGYGTQRAGNITGSISRVNEEELTKVSTPTLSQSLQGKTSGVYIKNVNAQPGENKTQINIRGFGAPLFIVDGMPVDEEVFQNLDPNDIQELNILKDAASAAVYGARAGNGVVIVQTKRGLLSEPKFSYRFEAATQFLLKTALPDIVNSHEWMELRNMVDANEGKALQFSRELIEFHRQYADGSEPELYPNVNIYDQTLKEYAPMFNNSLSVRGGTDKASYFISGSWLNQRGILISDEIVHNRYSLRANTNIRLTDKLGLVVDISTINRDYIGPRNQLEGEDWGTGQGIMARMRRWRPFYSTEPLPNPDLPRGAPQGQTINPINATYSENSGYLNWKTQHGDVKLNLEYELPYNLKTKVVFNYNRDDYRWKQYQKRGPEYQYNKNTGEHYVVRYINGISEVRQRDELTENINLQYFLEWDETFAQKHTFRGLFVAEYLTGSYDMIEAWRQNYDFDIDQLFAGPASDQYNNSLEREGGRVGYIGKIGYSYLDKYNLEFSSRLDGSPQFPEEGRWGFFPSVSASWLISEESFIKDNSSFTFLDNFKFRASIGKLGYDRAGDFQYLATYSFAQNYIYSGTALQRGIRANALPNPYITWEEMGIANIGIDFSLWNRKLEGSFDAFQRNRKNVLGVRNTGLPSVIGATMPQENFQEFQNKGWEAMLNHSNKAAGLTYNIGGNVSFTREKTILTDEPEFATKESERRNSRENKWSNRVWMYPSDGLFKSKEEINNWADIDGRNNATIQPGDVRYIDTNGDGRITPDDLIIVGSGTMPRFTYGLNGSIMWKNFEFFMGWQGAGLYGYNLRSTEYAQPFNSDGAPLQHHLNDSYVPEGNEWRPANTNAKWPLLRISPAGASYSPQVQQWWINGAYLRLRQLQLTYNIPSQFLKKIGVDNLGIFAAGYNLFTISALDFIDPEIDTSPKQFMGNYHPQMGSYNFGINLNF